MSNGVLCVLWHYPHCLPPWYNNMALANYLFRKGNMNKLYMQWTATVCKLANNVSYSQFARERRCSGVLGNIVLNNSNGIDFGSLFSLIYLPTFN